LLSLRIVGSLLLTEWMGACHGAPHGHRLKLRWRPAI
jgi:hypothetical protein